MVTSELPANRAKEYGVETLSTSELLSLIVGGTGATGKDPMAVAENIVNQYSTLRDICNASVENLTEVKGLGEKRAIMLKAAVEIGRRLVTSKTEDRVTIKSPKDVRDLVFASVIGEPREHFRAVFLNTKNDVVKIKTISVGILNAALIHPRDLFREAVKVSAASVVVTHNHPSGDPTPSHEDIEVTKRLYAAGKIMGIDVLDHVITGDGDKWISMKERGLM